ncbi:8318_t:CDS:2 [Diversispora eburnea]|uniref:8318_t:CDS:1 n=1 Tax=Diversispora eburnea TaxID=1213867 RepID=A0A9N8YTP9_9GLOM|nr:8318_t:CDS:2 [Diversispora eburnea]
MAESSNSPYFTANDYYSDYDANGYRPNWGYYIPHSTEAYNDGYYNNFTDYGKDVHDTTLKIPKGFDESNIDPTFFKNPSMVNPSATFQLDYFKKKKVIDKDEIYRCTETRMSGRSIKSPSSTYGNDDNYSESSQSPNSSSLNQERTSEDKVTTQGYNVPSVNRQSRTSTPIQYSRFQLMDPPYRRQYSLRSSTYNSTYSPNDSSPYHNPYSPGTPPPLSRTPQRDILSPKSLMASFRASTSIDSPKKHACNYCNMRFSRPSTLQTHIYTHTGEKPFRCNEDGCGRCFSVVSNLRRHQKIHVNKKGQNE